MVIWSEPAKLSLKQIHDFIAIDSKYYASEVVDKIIEKSEKLDSFPKMGRIVPEIRNDNVREIFIYSYRIIYEVIGEDIKILTLVHAKRNFDGEI